MTQPKSGASNARTLLPEIEARRHLLDTVRSWRDMTPEISAQWDAPYGPPEQRDVQIEETNVEGPHGSIRLRIYRPPLSSPSRASLIWCHGGAFVFGDLDMPEAHEVSRGIAGRADAVVISVDYSLGPPPGTPRSQTNVHFPIPHDEVVAVYRWAVDNSPALGIDPARICIGGASAGGNLAAGAALYLREQGESPWQVLLAYPVLHPKLPPPGPELADAVARLPQTLRFPEDEFEGMTANYIGGPTEGVPAYAFPGVAADLAGFPPTFINDAEFDDLRSGSEEFVRRLRGAGVDVEYTTSEGVPHGHLNNVGLKAAHKSLDLMAARIRRGCIT